LARREFTKAVKVEILKRSIVDGTRLFWCEQCHAMVASGEIHHIRQDAMEIDKSVRLTAADGQFLCKDCHAEITKQQAPVMAKVKRIEAKHLGLKKPSTLKSAGFPKKVRAHSGRSPPDGLSQLARRFQRD
jgi:hypothetical protein